MSEQSPAIKKVRDLLEMNVTGTGRQVVSTKNRGLVQRQTADYSTRRLVYFTQVCIEEKPAPQSNVRKKTWV